MKKYVFLLALAIAALVTVISAGCWIDSLLRDNSRLNENVDLLHARADALYIERSTYMTADSLKAVKIDDLSLTLSEFKELRAKDYELIKSLQVEMKGLETVVTTQMQTITELRTALRDTTILVDSTFVVAKTFDYKSRYTDVRGTIANDTIDLEITNREELIVVEHVTKKKFIGIKLPIWLFGYADRQIDVSSMNKCTTITDVEFIKVNRQGKR